MDSNRHDQATAVVIIDDEREHLRSSVRSARAAYEGDPQRLKTGVIPKPRMGPARRPVHRGGVTPLGPSLTGVNIRPLRFWRVRDARLQFIDVLFSSNERCEHASQVHPYY